MIFLAAVFLIRWLADFGVMMWVPMAGIFTIVRFKLPESPMTARASFWSLGFFWISRGQEEEGLPLFRFCGSDHGRDVAPMWALGGAYTRIAFDAGFARKHSIKVAGNCPSRLFVVVKRE